MTVFAQENDVWFSDQYKWEGCVTFDIFVLGRSDWFLKAISRVKKSASEVKIGQIVHHMGAFPQANAALGISRLCCGGSKSVWDANIGFQASVI